MAFIYIKKNAKLKWHIREPKFPTLDPVLNGLPKSNLSWPYRPPMWCRDAASIAWRWRHPPPHNSNSNGKWWKPHFGSNSSSVVCHSHYCFIMLTQPLMPHDFSSPLYGLYNASNIALFSLSVVTVLRIRFLVIVMHTIYLCLCLNGWTIV